MFVINIFAILLKIYQLVLNISNTRDKAVCTKQGHAED